MPGTDLLIRPPALTPLASSVAAEIEGLAASALVYAEAAKAQATRRAYRSAWRAFTTWCERLEQQPLPAAPATVAGYLIASASRLKVSSLGLHRAAIDAMHRDADLPTPDSAMLRNVWDAIKRRHGRPPTKKRAISTVQLRRALKKTPDTLTGARDRALILLGFASALRRSELASLHLGGSIATVRAEFVDGGVEISIDRSKGDQQGRGAIVAVPYGRHPATCPVEALRAWLKASAIDRGPIFRAVGRGDRLSLSPISDRTVARVVKAMAVRAGLDPDLFAGHSLRSGMITESALAGADHEALQAHARHARWDTTRGYIQAAERFGKANAAAKLGL